MKNFWTKLKKPFFCLMNYFSIFLCNQYFKNLFSYANSGLFDLFPAQLSSCFQFPKKRSGPGRIWTYDQRIMSPLLWPAELQAPHTQASLSYEFPGNGATAIHSDSTKGEERAGKSFFVGCIQEENCGVTSWERDFLDHTSFACFN